MFRYVKKLHFVGIGGIGMSGIAELLLNLGFKITGSDINDSAVIKNLRNKGADVAQGHAAKNVIDADVLVYSSAVQEDNPEVISAQEKGIPVIRRAEMLGEFIALKETSIGVAGTHGKTSTSASVTFLAACPWATSAPLFFKFFTTAESLISDPVILKPRFNSSSAIPLMPIPPIPTKCTFLTCRNISCRRPQLFYRRSLPWPSVSPD